MNDILVNADKKTQIQRVIYFILTGLLTGLYALISSLASMPYAEGWNSYYAKCINDGQQIYQDFSYMFWPLFQNIITTITKVAGYDIYILRLVGAVLFALIAMSAYLIFMKLVKPGYAMIAATCSAFYLQSEIVQVFYDYVRFMDLFAYLSILLLLCTFIEKILKEDVKRSRSLIYSAAAGLFSAFFTCTKQNMGILFFVFAVCLFIFFMMIWTKKQMWKTLICYILTYGISIYGFLVVSLGNTNIKDFFDLTITSASSAKGGITAILFNWIKNGLPLFLGQAKLVLFLFAVLIINVLSNNEKIKNTFLCLKTVSIIKKFLVSIVGKIKEHYIAFTENHTSAWVKILNGIIKLISSLVRFAAKYIRVEYLYFCAVLFIVIAGSKKEALGIYFSENLLISQYAIYLFDIIVFAYCAVKMICCKINKKDIKPVFPIFCILCGSVFAIGYGCGTSGGLSQGELGLGLGVLICILFNSYRSKIGRVFNVLTIGTAFVVSATCISFKYVHPYNWWGMTQPSIYECTYYTDIPLFKHIYMSEDTGKLYEDIIHNIVDNTKLDDKIFCFPHIPVFYLASEREDIGTYSKVQWFDVCSDEIIDKDIEYISDNPPKAIVVYNIPDWVQTSHETMFRSGQKSSMRKMGEYLYDFALTNGYTYYGKYEINSDNSISLYIDDGKTHFDFYESGSGTREDPFIINSKAQLLGFAKMIESGWTFENKFLALGNDINLNNEEWQPIGNYKKQLGFKGNFDGRGHKIKNLKITTQKKAGFFEYLSGEIYNFGFEEGYISGELCGTIAAYSDGIITNCYSSVTLEGDMCGGIAGKSSGTIYNCLYFGQFINCSLYNIANDMGNMVTFDCYLTERSVSSLDIRQISLYSPNNYFISDEILNSQYFTDILNENLLSYPLNENLYHKFIPGENGTPEFSEKYCINIDKSKLYLTKASDNDENSDYITVVPGAIQYGPYIPLNKGNYIVTLYGENLTYADYDVFSQKMNYYPAISNMKRTNTCVSFNFSVKSTIKDAEIRSINSSESSIFIDKIIIEGSN